MFSKEKHSADLWKGNCRVARIDCNGWTGCRRPSAVANLNSITTHAAQGPRYKLSYDEGTIQQPTHSSYYPETGKPRTQSCDIVLNALLAIPSRPGFLNGDAARMASLTFFTVTCGTPIWLSYCASCMPLDLLAVVLERRSHGTHRR